MAYTITAKQLIDTIATAADKGTNDYFISQLQSLFNERYGHPIDLDQIKGMVNVMRCAYELVRTHMHPGFICADTSIDDETTEALYQLFTNHNDADATEAALFADGYHEVDNDGNERTYSNGELSVSLSGITRDNADYGYMMVEREPETASGAAIKPLSDKDNEQPLNKELAAAALADAFELLGIVAAEKLTHKNLRNSVINIDECNFQGDRCHELLNFADYQYVADNADEVLTNIRIPAFKHLEYVYMAIMDGKWKITGMDIHNDDVSCEWLDETPNSLLTKLTE